jgi:hypothetical protein
MKNKLFILLAAMMLALPSFTIPLLANASGNGASNSPVSAGTSLNWAGYTATGGMFTSVGASWTIPRSSAPSGGAANALSADATWVGIGGVSNKDLIQAGTQTVFQNGTPSYEAWYELLPNTTQQIPLTVQPGDAMTVSIAQQSSGQWIISFLNGTTGKSYSTSVSYQSSLSSADWIEEMPSATNGLVALDNFGTASFTNGYTVENGTQLTLAAASAQPLTMINPANQALAVPSSLGADGASFSVTRTSVAASTASIAPGIVTGRGSNGNGYGSGNGTSTGRWSRTGVGAQGYTPPARTTRSAGMGASASAIGTKNELGYFHVGFGNFPAFFKTFENSFRDGRKK